MKALNIVTLLCATIFPVLLHAEAADSANKAPYNDAKQHLENMISGKKPASYEQAIYSIENAWYDGKLNHATFSEAINRHLENIAVLITEYTDSIKLHPASGFDGTKEQKLTWYKTALANFAIYQYMTTPSIWIDDNYIRRHNPYQYSYNDPMGTADWTNTQVAHLLDEGSGNCFALASLFHIFSERLSSDARLCTAPGHIYIRHADDKGIFYNVELSSRSFPGTGTIETLTYTPEQATRNNISLRELDLKQSIALCLVYLAKGYEYKYRIKDDDFILSCAETALKYDDKNLNAMLLKAEVLESRLVAVSNDVKTLSSRKDFAEYEQWLTHIYKLGYREMPFGMKNQLIKGWTKDTILQLAAKDHTSSRTNNPHMQPTRYASLSWGLFDEEIKTKPLERFGNTIYDTRKNKIVAFVDDDVLFNQYNFDVGVFALSIDPLAAKYPSISPYTFVANSPIMFVDHDGKKIYIYYTDEKGNNSYYEYGSKIAVPNNSFVQQTVASLDYISQVDLTTQKVVSELTNTTKKLNISESKQGAFNMATEIPLKDLNGNLIPLGTPINPKNVMADEATLPFNPNAALSDNSGNKSISPATAMSHELSHVFSAFTSIGGYLNTLGTPEPNFGNYQEKNATEFEHRVAGFAGEWKRNDHKTGKEIITVSPTSNQPIVGNESELGQGEQIILK